jgi:hypothetical protein
MKEETSNADAVMRMVSALQNTIENIDIQAVAARRAQSKTKGTNCFGTAGTAGSATGTFGTLGTFGCLGEADIATASRGKSGGG